MVKFLERVPLYPFLAAAYPVIFLLSENIHEINPLAGLRSLLLLLVIAGASHILGRLITKNCRKGALVALVIILIFFLFFFVLYAPLYRGLREVTLFGRELGRHSYLVPLVGVILAAAAISAARLIRHAREPLLGNATLVMNVMSLVLLLIPVIGMLLYGVRQTINSRQVSVDVPALAEKLTPRENPPDIYLIILDTHISDTAMLNLMGYSDPGFSAELRRMGFFVSECSKSNYPSTQYSLVSQLNLDYIPSLTASRDLKSLYQLMENNRVVGSLKELGYTTYAFETGYKFTELKTFDTYLRPLSRAADLFTYPGVTQFESLLLKVSGGKILYETRDYLSDRLQFILDAPYVEYRDRILFDLETLPTLAAQEGPKFVFAHILAPHSPFVFDKDGDLVNRRTPFALDSDPEGYDWYSYSDAYYNELLYVHERMLEVVEGILAKSETPPVIIIQGDHGIPRTASRGAHFEIYNAFYIGGEEVQELYDTISPVNSFRVVFNLVFNTRYPLLPDESFSYDEEKQVFDAFEGQFTCP
jgi:hypothetical protein